MIDRTRVADGYLFATHGDRCFYLGKSASDRLHWLKENPGNWRSLEDVKQEAARLRPPVESETNLEAGPAEPNGQTSSHDVRKDGGEESDVTLVDAPAGGRSPPYQPTTLANPRIKNCQRKSRKPAECYRLSACELSSTALRKCPYFTTQLPKRAFIAKHLNIGSGAARPATPDTTSSGKALNGDFTNTAHQRSTRPTIDSGGMVSVREVWRELEACPETNVIAWAKENS